MHKVHEAVVVVVVVRALGRVDGQQQVVGAQAVALRVSIAEDARLQQLVVRVADAYAAIAPTLQPRHSSLSCQRRPVHTQERQQACSTAAHLPRFLQPETQQETQPFHCRELS